MGRYLIIRDSDGLVVNAVEWDGDGGRWRPPDGHTVMLTDEGNPGDIFDGSVFVPPPPPKPTETRIAALIDILDSKAETKFSAEERERLKLADEK